METAKGTDLPDLLEHLGYTVRRLGSRYHTTREMDSLRIKDRRTWKRYSNGTGGDAITFLQEFCGKDFREAVNYLLEFNGGRARDSPIPHPKPVQKKEKPVFTLPIAHRRSRGGRLPIFKREASPPRSSVALSTPACSMRTACTTTACSWAGRPAASRCSPASAAPMT